VLLFGVPNLAHDSSYHALLQRNFAQQLWAGDWYPRWLADLNGGLGSPVFFFYPALASYASSVFLPFVAGRDPAGWIQVGLGCSLCLILSGISAYYWLRFRGAPVSALFGAAIYVIAPYHTAIDLYNRAAVPELWTFVWMPLVLLSVEGVIARRRWAFPALSFSYALLVCSQIGVTFCFSAVPVAAALWLSERGQRMRTALATVAGMTLGAGLAAIFLLPGMLGGGRIHMEPLFDDFYHYRHWFLFQLPSLLDYKSRLLFLTLSMVACLATLFWVCLLRRPPRRERSAAVFYFGTGVFAFFFMTQASSPFWRVIPYLRFAQFPYRFGTLLTLAVAALSALAFCRIQEPRLRPWLYLTAFIVLGWIGADAWSASAAFSEWRRVPAERTRIDSLQTATFWPKTSPPGLWEKGRLEQFLSAHPARSSELTSAASGRRIGGATVASWRPRRFVLNVDAPEEARLVVNHFYYPGWRGRIGDSDTTIPAGPTSPDGLIQMVVPRGRYSLVVELARDGYERAGIAISLCSLSIVLAMGAMGLIKPRVAAGSPVED